MDDEYIEIPNITVLGHALYFNSSGISPWAWEELAESISETITNSLQDKYLIDSVHKSIQESDVKKVLDKEIKDGDFMRF